ncbi:MAG: YkvA family protein [Chloroflexota bacterium]
MNWDTVVRIAAGLIAVWVVLVALIWILRPRDVPLRELVGIVPDVLRLVRQLLGDRSVPFGVRAALVGLIAWLVNPIDLIPEFIPVLGPLDDVVVAVLVLRYVWRRLGDEELRRRWPGTPAGYLLLSDALRPRSP